MADPKDFWESVRELAAMRDNTPEERRAMSNVRALAHEALLDEHTWCKDWRPTMLEDGEWNGAWTVTDEDGENQEIEPSPHEDYGPEFADFIARMKNREPELARGVLALAEELGATVRVLQESHDRVLALSEEVERLRGLLAEIVAARDAKPNEPWEDPDWDRFFTAIRAAREMLAAKEGK